MGQTAAALTQMPLHAKHLNGEVITATEDHQHQTRDAGTVVLESVLC